MPRKQTPTREAEAAETARLISAGKTYNETGRGYFRHPVSPLATVRESFLPFIGQPASYAVKISFWTPLIALQKPVLEARFAQAFALFKQNLHKKRCCLKFIHPSVQCLFKRRRIGGD